MRLDRPVDADKIERLLRRGRHLSVIGIDDGPFRRDRRGDVLVCGVVCRGTRFEGLLTTRIRRDGWNATRRLTQMLRGSKFFPQLHLVLLDGVALGGLNVVDLAALAKATGRPCLTVMRRRPDLASFEHALAQLPHPQRRRALVSRAGPIHPGHGLWFQSVGLPAEQAREALRRLTIEGNVPEALRLAHLIGGGLVTGQSGRRA
jgi:hypothetical protein